MTRISVSIAYRRITAVAIAFATAALVAIAIAVGTALAAPGVPTPSASPSEAGDVNWETEGDFVTYTASPNSEYALDHWGIGNQAVSPDPVFPNRLKMSISDAVQAGSVTAYFKNTSDKQDWTGTTTIEKTADYGSSGSVSIAGYLPSDYGSYLEIPADSVSVSDPDSVLDSWSFDDEGFAVNFKFKNDASKAGKSATISATVKSEKYNDYTGSVVLTVSGEAPTAYKISVTADPADFGTASADKAEAAAGDTVKLTATPADRSYEFVEWKTETPDVTIKDDSFTMPGSDVVVTAVFKKKTDPVTTYAITFDANGGKGTMDKQTADAGATVALTANAFKRDGYTFTGWNTAKDGSGTAYADKANVKVDGDMTLYAQWKANAPSKSSAAKTGDTVMLETFAVMAVVALVAGALLIARRRLG